MGIDVVVYAEGGGEVRARHRPAFQGENVYNPGQFIERDDEGPAHIFVRRAITEQSQVRDGAVRFFHGLRLGARVPKGSDLHQASNIRKLVGGLGLRVRPHVAIVLIDRDGDGDRRKRLEAVLDEHDNRTFVPILAIAVEEFEAWLIADHGALSACGLAIAAVDGSVEGLEPGRAKELLGNAIGARGAKSHDLRRDLANRADLKTISDQCGSFRRFESDLQSALERIAPTSQ